MKKITSIFLSILCCFTFLAAQNKVDKAIKNLTLETNAIVSKNKATSTATFIRFPKEAPLELMGNSAIEKANSFLEQYGTIFGNLNVDIQLQEKELKTDNYGYHHLTITQQYKGIDVFCGILKFHFTNDWKITAINGTIIPNININTNFQLTENEAIAKAMSEIEIQGINLSGESLFVHSNQLMVYRDGLVQGIQGINYLVYEIEIRNHLDVRETFYIDAHKGTIIEQITGIEGALNRRLSEGVLANNIWSEGDPFPGTLTTWQQHELTAAEHTYNFFKNAFGFISYDNEDAIMRTIHDPANLGCPNASWNGATINVCNGVGTDDIVGHEWGHAYTDFTSDYIYAWQPGALNESYSDIWGETIDILNNYNDDGESFGMRTNCNNSDRWLIGESATSFGGAIRDMWRPSCFGDPGRVTAIQYFCGNGDQGGVHTNSGVNNHAYALLVDGGDYNGQSIPALGFTKAVHIFWRALSIYGTPSTNFANHADALDAACADLLGMELEGLSVGDPVGPSGEFITSADCEAVAAMILAVEFREETNCGFATLLEQDPPALCETNETIFLEDFETGLDGWAVAEFPVSPATWDDREWSITTEVPGDNNTAVAYVPNPIIGDCATDLENGIVRLQSPVINIPNIDTIHAYMTFDHYVATEPFWDGGNLKYKLNSEAWEIVPNEAFTFNGYVGNINPASEDNDNPMEGQPAFTGADEGSVTSSWGQSQLDLEILGAAPGSSIRFRWELGEDGCNGNDGWYIDNVHIYSCIEENTTPNQNIFDESSRLSTFPNPFDSSINVELPNNTQGNITIDIIDITGKIVFTQKMSSSQNNNLNIENLDHIPNGIFWLKIETQNKIYTQKIVKLNHK